VGRLYNPMKKLNLGCGRDIKKGYINLDVIKTKGIDVVHNLEIFPYPFNDNYFDEIYCSHVLEHLTKFIKVMEELYRISKDKAIIKIISPYFASSSAFHSDHKLFLTLQSFNYFLKDNFNNYMSIARFKIISKKIKFTRKRWWFSDIIEYPINKFQNIYERCFCFIIPFHEIEYILEVEK